MLTQLAVGAGGVPLREGSIFSRAEPISGRCEESWEFPQCEGYSGS